MAQELTKDQLWELMRSGKDFKLVDALSADHYERVHIKGAISLPSSQVTGQAESKLSKDDMIVVYCANPECDASAVTARKLESLGYTNVYHYAGGIEEWLAAGLPMEGSGAERIQAG
jgi:rhodanese-related sulfurtransferase